MTESRREVEGTARSSVLYVGTLPPHPGGTAVSAYQLLLALADLGHSIRSVAPVTPATQDQAASFDVQHGQLRVCRYPVPHFDFGGPVPPRPGYRDVERKALRALLPPMIDAHRPGVVIAGRESYAWDVPGIAADHGVPSILLLRGGTQTSGLLEGRYPGELAHQFLEGARSARRVIAVSRHLTDGFVRLGLTGVETITNFVDIDRFSPRPKDPTLLALLDIPADGIVVMHVANLKPRKRSIDVVLSAIHPARRDPRLVYVIVGDGSLREPMERRCESEGLSRRFRFVGWVDYDRVPAYLSLADVVVMPSETEGLARAYVETMACGRVLIASDIPPAREVVEPGETGLLFRLGDPDDLAATTLLAAGDAELRRRIGRAARARVYPLDAAARAYSAIIEGVARAPAVTAGPVPRSSVGVGTRRPMPTCRQDPAGGGPPAGVGT